jgi:hypothetical protein
MAAKKVTSEESKRKALAARAKRIASTLAQIAADVTAENVDASWLARARRTLDAVELGWWGYREVSALEYQALADHVEAFASSFARASEERRPAVLSALTERLAKERPELVARLDAKALGEALLAWAAPRGQRWAALHTLAKKSGVPVPRDPNDAKAKLLRARRRRNPAT